MSSRFRERALIVARACGLTAVFVVAAATGVYLHLDLPPARRVVARNVEALLNDTFQGRFEIGSIERLSPLMLRVSEVRVRDPQGVMVLGVYGLRVRADAIAIVSELLSSAPQQTVVIDHVRAERAEVAIIPDPASGTPTIAAAFSLSPKMKAKPPSATPSTLRVWLPAIELGAAAGRGRLEGTPTTEARVRGVRGSVLVSPAGVAVDAERFSTLVRVAGSPELRGIASFHQRGTTRFFGSFDGYLGELQVNSVARLNGKRLKATLDLPNAEPALVRAIVPDWPVQQTLVARVELAGEIPNFRTKAELYVGESEIAATGELRVAAESSLRLAVTGKRFDLRAVLADSPETRIDTQGELFLLAGARGVTLDFTGSTEPNFIEGVLVPPADFSGRFADGRLEARGMLHEPGMPVDATFALDAEGVIHLEARAKRFRVDRAPRAHALVPAHGGAGFHAKARIEDGRLDAEVDADLDGFSLGPVRAGQAKVRGRATGPIAQPRALKLDARGSGREFRAGEFAFDTFDATVRGSVDRLEIAATLDSAQGPNVTATTTLRGLDGTRLDDVDLRIRRGDVAVSARAARIDLEAGSVQARNVSLEGAGGKLTGSLNYRPELFELEARGEDLDLAAISRVLGAPPGTLSGKIDLDADVVAARDLRRGELRVSLREGAFGSFGGLELDVVAALAGDALTGEATTSVAGYGRARAAWEIELSGDPFESERWEHATGRVDLGLETVELSRLKELLPAELGISEVRGQGVAQLSLLRSAADRPPSLDFLGATHGLALTIVPGGRAEERIEVSGVELGVSASVDGGSGATDASVRLVDQYGLLLSSTGRVVLDVPAILERPAELLEQLGTRELSIAAVVEERPFGALPEVVRPSGVNGTLRLEGNLRGTLAAPVLSLRAALGAVTLGEEVQAEPFDACLRAQYDPSARRFGLGAELYLDDLARGPCAGKRVAVANAAGAFDLEAARRGKRAFRGDAQVSLEDVPLEFVTPLARAHIAGRANGRAALVQSEDEPLVHADIHVTDATVRGLELGEGRVEVRSNGPDVRALLSLRKNDGSLEADGRAGLDWTGLVPSLDRSRAVGVTARVRNVDAAVLQPLLEDVVSDLTGRLDGELRVALDPQRTPDGATGLSGDVTGKVSLEEGSLQLAGLGMRLSAVRFDAEAKKVGSRTVVSVRRLFAASRSRNQNVSASADLYLDGLEFVSGRANANLREVPFMIQGTPQAELTGSAAVELERLPDRVRVTIALPKMTAELPRSAGSGVISTGANPDIEILQPIAEPVLRSSGGALPWELQFVLGRDVIVQRADLRVPIEGAAKVVLAEEVDVTGDIDLEPGGRIQLLGKTFIVEQGEVHFDTGDPSNPHLRVLASWRAPDGTLVYVEVRGTFREATLRLESDPPRAEAEIQALLLGGGATDGGEAQTAGVGYGADFVSALLADTNLPHVELRTGTEAAADDRRYSTYTAAVQISDEVWVEGSYKNLSAAESTEQGDAFSGTVDWRFRQNWSLRTEFGNIGTGLDLLWQYRY